MMDWIMAVLAIGITIFIHELGHLIAGKRKGIPISTFSLGFGPRLVGFRRADTDYRLSLIPLGGFVIPKMKDMEDFHSIPVSSRVAFSLGGPMMNIVFALVLLSIFDVITFGLTPMNLMILPFIQIASFFVSIATAYATILTDIGSISGIVGMASEGGTFISGSFMKFIFFMILINMNLAVFNLLPIPVLDGGKIVMALLEKISLRTRKAQVPITIASLVLIIGLMFFTTIMDVIGLLNGDLFTTW
ncbi:MAG: site-2 protease family protein [Thermoplasmatota archaeon]